MSNERISAVLCQRRLAILWLVGSGIAVLIVVAQTIGQKPTQATWDWLLPNIVPTLTLMIGALVMAEKKRVDQQKELTSDRFLFRLAMGFSAFYLMVLFMVLISSASADIRETIKGFSLLIPALQGLVGLILGAFFVKG